MQQNPYRNVNAYELQSEIIPQPEAELHVVRGVCKNWGWQKAGNLPAASVESWQRSPAVIHSGRLVTWHPGGGTSHGRWERAQLQLIQPPPCLEGDTYTIRAQGRQPQGSRPQTPLKSLAGNGGSYGGGGIASPPLSFCSLGLSLDPHCAQNPLSPLLRKNKFNSEHTPPPPFNFPFSYSSTF